MTDNYKKPLSITEKSSLFVQILLVLLVPFLPTIVYYYTGNALLAGIAAVFAIYLVFKKWN